jgi:hypothetical protein
VGWKTINGRRYYYKCEHDGGRGMQARFFRFPQKPRLLWCTVAALSAAAVFVCTFLFLAFHDSQDVRSRAADADLPSEAGDEGFPTARSIAEDIGYQGIDKAYLLAFKSEIDERPLFVESALIAVKLKPGNWWLAHVYRHPRDSHVGALRWNLSAVRDAPFTPEMEFRHQPSKYEVETFLRDTWWEFSPSDHFRLLRARVFSDTWEKVLGYRPNHQFSGRNSAAPDSPPAGGWIHWIGQG